MDVQRRSRGSASLRAPESAHQPWGGSPHRTAHWLSVVEGNCVVERRGGRQPEMNCQSINKAILNTIRPDALASLRRVSEAQNRTPTRKGQGNFGDLSSGETVSAGEGMHGVGGDRMAGSWSDMNQGSQFGEGTAFMTDERTEEPARKVTGSPMHLAVSCSTLFCLWTGSSSQVASHPVLRRRSFLRLRTTSVLSDGDFHPTVGAHSQAHAPARPAWHVWKTPFVDWPSRWVCDLADFVGPTTPNFAVV
jgi:hypothetical protein